MLTDGAIWDTEKVINLVKSKCNLNQRMHTFGVGHNASEELIKQCACKGFGQFQFIYDEEQIEESVITALSKTRLSYKILQKLTLHDSNGARIETELDKEDKPLLEGEFVDMTCLLRPGEQAHSYRVEILEPNSGVV